MIFSKNALTCKLPNPLYGYETVLHLAVDRLRNPYNGMVDSVDYGMSNDYITFTGNWKLTKAEMISVNSFFENEEVRSQDIQLFIETIELGGGGFYPFGPQFKDNDCVYTVCEIENSRSSRLHSPFNYYDFTMSLVLRVIPEYIVREPVNQGDMSINFTGGLPYVDTKITYNRCNKISLSNGGIPLSNDIGQNARFIDTNLKFEINTNNTERLLSQLQFFRASEMTIDESPNNHIFGAEFGNNIADYGTYNVQLINKEIKIIHGGFNMFRFDLAFHLIEEV